MDPEKALPAASAGDNNADNADHHHHRNHHDDDDKSLEANLAPPNDHHDRGLTRGDTEQPDKLRPTRSHLSIERSWSLNDGLSCVQTDEAVEEEEAAAAAGAAGDQQSFVVGWDENDPMNPRSLSLARKWLITILVSLGSLCV